MTGPQPGWYPDPEDTGRARYWDGDAWTDHAHPVGPTSDAGPSAATDPPTAEPAADADPTAPLGPGANISPTPGPETYGGAAPTGGTADTWSTEAAGHPPPPAPATDGGTGPPSGSSSAVPAVLVAVIGSIVLVSVLAVFALSGSATSGLFDDPGAATEPTPETPAEPRTVDPDALDTAGCVAVEAGDGSDRSHFDLDDAPPAEELYDVPLPAWGPHTPQVLPELGLVDRPLDVRVLLHNLEHGAIVVWLDEAAHGDPEVRDEVAEWLAGLRDGGFRSDAGSNLYASPTPDDADVAPVSLRAWGVAVDCPGWDRAAADAFVADHYGSRGEAPESVLGPYPEDGPLRDP